MRTWKSPLNMIAFVLVEMKPEKLMSSTKDLVNKKI